MIITSIEELRLASPAHALDSIDGLVGFIDNSEHDFLEEKLGTPLYEHLCKWYDENPMTRSSVSDYMTSPLNQLLLMCQRCVAFDALGRAAGMQGVSVNNAGLNQMIADDYKAADKDAVATYRQTCYTEAHAALNQLLRQLEKWCNDFPPESGGARLCRLAHPRTQRGLNKRKKSDDTTEIATIVELWQQSSYYYLAAALLLPSCTLLQQYLNIYDNREKYIQLLPDLQFIQEEIIGDSIGEDLLKAVIDFARDAILPAIPNEGEASPSETPEPNPLLPIFTRLTHRLRKVMTALLEGRTQVLKISKERKVAAHDDGVRMLGNVISYLRANQDAFPEELVKDAPWYEAPAPEPEPPTPSTDKGGECCCKERKDKSACWTPPLL